MAKMLWVIADHDSAAGFGRLDDAMAFAADAARQIEKLGQPVDLRLLSVSEAEFARWFNTAPVDIQSLRNRMLAGKTCQVRGGKVIPVSHCTPNDNLVECQKCQVRL